METPADGDTGPHGHTASDPITDSFNYRSVTRYIPLLVNARILLSNKSFYSLVPMNDFVPEFLWSIEGNQPSYDGHKLVQYSGDQLQDKEIAVFRWAETSTQARTQNSVILSVCLSKVPKPD